jgi:hypothetical protein
MEIKIERRRSNSYDIEIERYRLETDTKKIAHAKKPEIHRYSKISTSK